MTKSSQEAVDRILAALGEALRATRRIGEIEAEVGRSRGYFSKVAAGKWRISLDLLLRTLEILEIDSTTFFANALAEPEEAENESDEAANELAAVRRHRARRLPNLADLPHDILDRPSADPWRRR